MLYLRLPVIDNDVAGDVNKISRCFRNFRRYSLNRSCLFLEVLVRKLYETGRNFQVIAYDVDRCRGDAWCASIILIVFHDEDVEHFVVQPSKFKLFLMLHFHITFAVQ